MFGRLMVRGLVAVALATVLDGPPDACGSSITITQTGIGTGSIGGVPFTAEPLVITSIGDTSERVSVSAGFYYVPSDSAYISINGVGTYQFITATDVFINGGSVGLQRAPEGFDLLGLKRGFGSWDMLSSIGPITGTAELEQWESTSNFDFPPVVTTGGTLIFPDQYTSTTFQATVSATPEPSTLAILITGAVGLLVCGGRRRRRSDTPGASRGRT